jgi:ComF family protein
MSPLGLRPLRRLAQMTVDFIYPPLCLLCDEYLPEGEVLICRTCFRHLPQLEEYDIPSQSLRTPLRKPLSFDRAIALYDYAESVGKLIHFFKYRGGRALARPFGEALGLALADGGYAARAIIPVPLHTSRLRERGYNQSELLARVMAEVTGLTVWPCALRRTVATPPQARMGRSKRLRNLRGLFAAQEPALLAGESFILVDDVLTTGHTLDECARVLVEHGACRVIGATIARVR